MLRLAISLALLLALTAMSAPPAESGWSTKTFEWDGIERSYEWYNPGFFGRTNPRTLVVQLHGGGGSGRGFCENKVKLDTDPIGKGWFIACPDGIGGSWNTREDPTKPDDLGFLAALIEDRVAARNIEKVVVVGHSLGGIMTWAMVCGEAGLLDAVVISAGTNLTDGCAPEAHVAGLAFHGVNWEYQGSIGDKRIPYTCPLNLAECEQKRSSRPRPPARDAIEQGAGWNGCDPDPTSTPYPDEEAVVVEWQNCIASVQVVELSGSGKCHGWPGGPNKLGCDPYTFPGTRYLADWVDGELGG